MGKINKASAIRNCSMPRLLTLPSAGCQSINNLTPLSDAKGFSYPYKVIHKLWITFNFSSENIFKIFQNIFPIQVHRMCKRIKSINLVLTRFIKDWFVSYSINFVSLFPIKIIKRQLLIPWLIHRLWISFSQLSNPSPYLLASFYFFYSKFWILLGAFKKTW